MPRSILLYELNEVPFRILDEFRRWRPNSVLAKHLDTCSQYETVSEDEVPLSPWITWPTVHRGVTYQRHRIHNFGQPLESADAKYPPVWRILRNAGVRVGVFGSLHSYPPPPDVRHYEFYLPDAFALSPDAHPEGLVAFQDFNLRLSRESARNVSTKLHWGAAARLASRLPTLGLRPQTVLDVLGQLAAERRNPWRRVRRRTYQTVLGFDVFLKQMRRTQPQFATFFSNHVASAMHRYWAASFPDDYDRFDYDDMWVERWKDEIDFAMSKFDEELDRLIRHVHSYPEYLLVVTSSMGQAATETKITRDQLFPADLGRFMRRLGLEEDAWERRPAMLPDVNVLIAPRKVDHFRRAIENLLVTGRPLRCREEEGGFFSLGFGRRNVGHEAPYAILYGERVHYADLGLKIREVEDQTHDNAYHVPEGSLLVYDPQGAAPDTARRRISTIEIAPAIVSQFGIDPPSYMREPTPVFSGCAS